MKSLWVIAGAALLLSGCGGSSGVSRSLETAPLANGNGVADYPVKIGEPYELGGVTYTPSDAYNYDETGYASWYGKEMSGRNTANGELFNPDAITGAHRTLPLPSYAEVTALDTGKTILVRLNDRGPASPSRLIDLSYGAAKQLGVLDKGTFAVRVRRVNPPESERAVLRAGQPVAMRMETPEALLVPLRRKLDGKPKPAGAAAAEVTPPSPAPRVAAKPVPKPAPAPKPAPLAKPAPVANTVTSAAVAPRPVPAPKAQAQGTRSGRFIIEGEGTRPTMAENSRGDNRATLEPQAPASPPVAGADSYVVQVAAFGSRARANELARRIGAQAVASGDGKLFRVRYGPYRSEDAAQQGLTLARRNGYQSARIQKDTDR